jgi:putative DNA primase/helicase
MQTTPINPEKIPAELRALPQWIAWKYGKKKDGSTTKLPVNVATGKLASTTDPATWTSFDDALAKQNGAEGPGYVFSAEDPFCGVDFDGCRNPETGEIAPWARERIIRLNTYAEVSPSKMGVKAWVKAKWPLPKGKKITLHEPDFVVGKKPGIEVYDHGRYFAVTGLKLANLPDEPQERQAEIDELCRTFFSERARIAASANGTSSRTSVIERARKYLDAIPGAVSGSGGHNQTFHVACVLVLGFGLTKAEALGLLSEYNQKCEPPWSEAELQHKIESADAQPGERGYLRDKQPDEWAGTEIPNYQQQQPAPETATATEFPATDSGNAELFASCNAGSVLYDHRRNQWQLWGAHYWLADSDGKIHRLAKAAARERYRRAGLIQDLPTRQVAAKWAISSESRQKLEAALSLARSERALADSGDEWNAKAFLLAARNGIIDLHIGNLRPGQPEDKINFHSDTGFDPAATCPRWLHFLEEIFDGNAELVDFVHRAAGYSISGDTREQVLFVCYGTGSNGKGILLNAIRKALGDYGHNMPFSTLEQQDRGGIPNDLAALVGRRFVTASETNQSARLNEARIKALTGCDPISARFLHCEWFTFQPVAKFWLAVNHRPHVSDDSFGFWRRVRIIPFVRRFTGADVDLRLDDKLSAEMPGILAWLVRGCLAWQERGLDPPECVKAATDEYRQESDPLADFISERCTVDPCRSAGSSDLFKAYRAWAMGCGMSEKEMLGRRSFGQRMAEKFTRRRFASGVFYEGIGLSM